jgi:hypothetical protein
MTEAVHVQVVIDCPDPAALAPFWAAALRYQVQPPPPGFDSWPEFLTARGVPESEWNSASAVVDPAGVGPRIFLQRVPESKSVKNRLHLDLRLTDPTLDREARRAAQAAEAERLTGLGAALVGERSGMGEQWIVMTDPAGNEFCIT